MNSSFLYLHKETNQQRSGEESAAVHLSRFQRDAQRCSQRTGDIGKSLSLRRAAFPFFAVLLGYVKWRNSKLL